MTREDPAKVILKSCKSLFCYGVAALSVCALGTPAPEATQNYWVAVDHPNASDSNHGRSLDRPFKTLRRATQELSPGKTLFIRKGIYREKLGTGVSGTAASPIVFRAYPGDEGEVVIRGSDVVKGWTHDGSQVWSVPWQPLPLLNYPATWPYVDEYAQRRELVFVDGNPLKQVLSRSELASGNFWMDDAAQRMRIHYSGDPNTSQVEISVRTEGVMARGRSHLVFRGLSVEHVSTELFVGAMALGPHARVENCWVEYNNGTGIEAYSDSIIIRTISNHNGRLGIGLSGNDSLLDSSETSYNSWRYGPGFAAGGVKIIDASAPSGNRFVRHTAKDNNGVGIAFDSVGSDNVVEASFLDGNVTAGIIFEATAGPNWAINNVIIDTVKKTPDDQVGGSGIIMDAALNTHIYNNTIVGVEGGGITIKGGARGGGAFYPANTRVFNNIIVDPGRSAINFKVWGIGAEEEQLASHRFDNNLYFNAEPTIIFKGSANHWSLEEFQDNRGEDLNSLYASPDFTDSASNDYSLRDSSPAIDSGRELIEITQDFDGLPRPQGSDTDIGAFESSAAQVKSRRPSSRRPMPNY